MDEVNGFIRVATSIVSYANLAQGTIGLTLVFFLYGPIARKETEKSNAIFSIANKWMKIFGGVYLIILLILSCLLPLMLFSNGGVVGFPLWKLMIIVMFIGIGVSFSYFVSGKYSLLLTAQNNKFIVTGSLLLINIATMAFVLPMMWKFHGQNHFIMYVALINAKVVFSGILITIYTKRKNKWIKIINIDKALEKQFKKKAMGSLVHQVATLIVFSTDEIVLAIYSNHAGSKEALILISIYSSYLMLSNFALTMISMLISSFENQIGLENNGEDFNVDRFLAFEKKSIIWISFSTMVLFLLLPHYTNLLFNTNNINGYFSYKISLLISIILILNTLRIPSSILVNVNGHFNETKWRAIIEATINIVLSLILVWFLNIYGVLIATVISFCYRTIDFFVYSQRFLDNKSLKSRVSMLLLIIIQIIVMIIITFEFAFKMNVWNLILYSIIVFWIMIIIYSLIFAKIHRIKMKKEGK
ncbi:polysaccharide biosynthesis C-terminal domain-containing protein [Mycoplasma todarodis]|uniref:polysaccharide biosynthesis C-terminal domain-containing protein n=1 Tax=Mycoplasma todarodis TaxID=1937191 RepID=UPI003B51443D